MAGHRPPVNVGQTDSSKKRYARVVSGYSGSLLIFFYGILSPMESMTQTPQTPGAWVRSPYAGTKNKPQNFRRLTKLSK